MRKSPRRRTVLGLAVGAVEYGLILVAGALMLRFIVLRLADFGISGIETWQSVLEGIDWLFHVRKLAYTSTMVCVAVLWSTALSFVVGYKLSKRPHRRIWDLLSTGFSFASGFPYFVVGLIVFVWMRSSTTLNAMEENSSWVLLFMKLLAGGLVLGSFEGSLGVMLHHLRTVFSQLQGKTYYVAMLARGDATYGLLYRAARPLLLKAMATRVSYLFGASIIVEKTINVEGLGYTMLYYIEYPSADIAFGNAVVSGLLILMVPAVVRFAICCVYPASVAERCEPNADR